MHYSIRRPWNVHESRHTSEQIYENRAHHRREFLKMLGIAGTLGWTVGLAGCNRATDEEVLTAGAVAPLPEEVPNPYRVEGNQSPASRNEAFEYGRPETIERETAEFTNFYEFSTRKDSWMHVGKFQPDPWSVQVDGLCAKPGRFDLDDFYKKQQFEERHYRHRCVETWAMCVPWTGFRLADLIQQVEPLPTAKYVAFETFGLERAKEAPHMAISQFQWPYVEGLTLGEATNELAFLATGIFGHQLPKQNGAPIRLVLPWKYGFKSIKSIVRITLTDQQPETFWNREWAQAYDFTANVDPDVPHPNWSQRTEWMLGTRERFDTVQYNGYGEYVADLYA